MIDVKKLTTYFLVLAGVVSLIALGFSGSGLYPRFGNAPSTKTSATARVPSNAFVLAAENLPPMLQRNLAGAETNITKATSENLAKVITGLNPYGSQTIDGQTGLVLPTTTVLVGYLTMENPRFKVSDLWTSPDNEQIAFAPTVDAASNRAYEKGFQDILKATLSSDGYLSLLGNIGVTGVNQEFLNISALTFSAAIQKLKALPTPAPFLEFQKNFLTYLEDQRNILFVIADANDPLKSLMVLNSGDQVKQRLDQDLSQVAQAYRALDPTNFLSQSGDRSWIASIADSLFPTARALGLAGLNPEDKCGTNFASNLTSNFANLANTFTRVPVFDQPVVKNTSGILGVLLYDCQSQIITQEAKKELVYLMNKQTLESVKNGGNSRLIEDYQSYFNDASAQGATAAYKQISGQICPQFQQYVDANVFNPADITGSMVTPNNGSYGLGSDTITTSTATTGGNNSSFGSSQVTGTGQQCQIVNQYDPNDFYDDFNNGGLDAYLNYLNPSNNLFGTLIYAQDAITSGAAGASVGANAESVANQGFRSDVNCLDYYTDANGNKICDQQQILTPGRVIGSQAETAVNSRYSEVINAQNLAGVDTAVADALGTKLQQHPDQGLYSLAVNTGNSLASVCQNLAPPSIAASVPNVNAAQSACNSIVGQVIGQFNKYVSLITNISSILGSFF